MTNDPLCTDCGGTGIAYQTERRCACQVTADKPAVGGMVMVPVEPTEAMAEAGHDQPLGPAGSHVSMEAAKSIYRAMLAAAPTPPAPAKGSIEAFNNTMTAASVVIKEFFPAAAGDDVVERVAKAIWMVDDHPARKTWDEAVDDTEYAEALNDCRAYARAGLSAIPTATQDKSP